MNGNTTDTDRRRTVSKHNPGGPILLPELFPIVAFSNERFFQFSGWEEGCLLPP